MSLCRPKSLAATSLSAISPAAISPAAISPAAISPAAISKKQIDRTPFSRQHADQRQSPQPESPRRQSPGGNLPNASLPGDSLPDGSLPCGILPGGINPAAVTPAAVFPALYLAATSAMVNVRCSPSTFATPNQRDAKKMGSIEQLKICDAGSQVCLERKKTVASNGKNKSHSPKTTTRQMPLPTPVKTNIDATLQLLFNDLLSGAVLKHLKKPWASGFYAFHSVLKISYEAGNIEVLA